MTFKFSDIAGFNDLTLLADVVELGDEGMVVLNGRMFYIRAIADENSSYVGLGIFPHRAAPAEIRAESESREARGSNPKSAGLAKRVRHVRGMNNSNSKSKKKPRNRKKKNQASDQSKPPEEDASSEPADTAVVTKDATDWDSALKEFCTKNAGKYKEFITDAANNEWQTLSPYDEEGVIHFRARFGFCPEIPNADTDFQMYLKSDAFAEVLQELGEAIRAHSDWSKLIADLGLKPATNSQGAGEGAAE